MKFPGVIRVDLTKPGEVEYPCTAANRLWLAKVVAVQGQIKTNWFAAGTPNPVLGIRIQKRTNDQLAWSIQDGFMNTFSGLFDKLFITVISNGAGYTELYLNTGADVAGGYCSNDGLSPVIGLGSGVTAPSVPDWAP